MPEPQYLGHVRFGAGEGCGCGRNRLLTVQKVHHTWTVDQSGIRFPFLQSPHTTGTELVITGAWFGPSGAGDIDRRGVYLIDRNTGLVDKGISLRDSDRAAVTGVAAASVDFDGGNGTIFLLSEYSPSALLADLQGLWDSSSLIAGTQWGGQSLLGRAEVFEGLVADQNRWQSVPYIGSAPADGRILVAAVSDGATVWFASRTATQGLVKSEFTWGRSIYRQRGQLGFQGFFSTWNVLRREQQGGQVEETVGAKSFFRLTKGVLDVQSPALTEEDCWSTDWKVARETWVQLDDLPPGGAGDATPIVGAMAAGGGC